ncbi:MAG TPA: hypothetical protein ENK82_03985 [Campylobacterales bacterium]|nr:hypothetical protein [Campylobacterales bacterium]HHS92481.1 hypothetical protein [Campylobacterales bacterium]
MKKIAIKFLSHEESEDSKEIDLKNIAQQLQRFIIEDDYRLSSIVEKIMKSEILVLDVGMEEAMPLFEDAVDEFDELGLHYQLYIQSKNGWQEIEYEKLSLELDRTPKWLRDIVVFNLLWFVVMSCIQFFPIYKFYDEKYEMGTLLTLVSSAVTGLVPIANSVVAYLGAVEFYDWKSSSALFAFFGYYLPLLGFLLYLIWLILKGIYADRWYRFWRPEFN